jgi:poly-gamma-glutamate synthesis protein (capsule biosynthesis protein)
MRIAFGGDTMLGRLVAETTRKVGSDYPLETIAPVFHAADLAVVNLECAITAQERKWTGRSKAFYFRADPPAAAAIARAGIDAVNLANNHALDFGREGPLETIDLLERAGVASFGAGRTLDEALAPAIVRAGDARVGFVGFTDDPADFAATEQRAGVAYLDIEHDRARALRTMSDAMARTRERGADLVVVSAHWGPNFDDAPEPEIVAFAHALIDAGADVVFGHSPHVFHGIELYGRKPILYAAGDLVDDYYVGDQANDRALVFTVTFDGELARRIDLTPCLITDFRVLPAPPAVHGEIRDRITRLSAALGTTVRADEQRLYIDCDTPTRLREGAVPGAPRDVARGR